MPNWKRRLFYLRFSLRNSQVDMDSKLQKFTLDNKHILIQYASFNWITWGWVTNRNRKRMPIFLMGLNKKSVFKQLEDKKNKNGKQITT